MHSRIFVLAPINKKTLCEEEAFYQEELDEVDVYDMLHECIPCDYVTEQESGSKEFNESLEWLNNTFPVYGDALMLTRQKREAYLNEKYQKLREELDKGLNNFIEKNWSIREMINERYSFYVICEDSIYTLDEFIFAEWHIKEDGYTITQVFDYHV